MRTILFVTLMLAAGAVTSFAQDFRAIAETKRAEMKRVDKMVGQWKGSGWIMQGPNRETFTGTENVQRKVDGLALLVEGRFTNPEGRVIHETLAAIAFDDKSKAIRMRTYLASGIAGEYDIKPVGENYEWGYEVGGGTIRYTIKIDPDHWNEVGEYTRDGGKTWMKVFEMNLDRVK